MTPGWFEPSTAAVLEQKTKFGDLDEELESWSKF
jgi:hypothetical protein